MATWLFLISGGIWFFTVQAIAIKHFNQGGRRMVRDMMNDGLPRLGQPREWEPHERLERRIMYWFTVVMMGASAVLFLILEYGA